MKLQAEGNSHIGLKRRVNEDSFIIRPDLDIYIVADGMGGHKAGEVASRMVVETITDYWERLRSKEIPAFLAPVKKDIPEIAKHLVNSISMTNIVVHEAQKKPQYLRMGSTVSAALLEEDTVWLANVGDSPIYLHNRKGLRLLSEEHSIEAEQKNMGFEVSLTSTNPMMKNMLTRVMGMEEKVEVYITGIIPEIGDKILMCSDGLTNYLPEESIKAILDDFSMPDERKVNVLIDEANKGGGGDNITVVLLTVIAETRWDRIKKKFKNS